MNIIHAVLKYFSEEPSVIIELLIGLFGFLGVIFSLKADRKVKIVEFIAEYNLTFLTQKEFTAVERKLEGCLDKYTKEHDTNGWKKDGQSAFNDGCDRIFNTKEFLFENKKSNTKFDSTGAIAKEYQSIVNYLVYLESFSTLITQKRVSIKDIDDLFGYRFFIAVNNPVLQENELIPYRAYYKGIIKAYKIWVAYYQKHRKNLFKKDPIQEPMSDYSLSKKLEE